MHANLLKPHIYHQMKTKKCLILLCLLCVLFSSCTKPQKTYVIGVSQCSADIWREKQNAELRIGAYMHDDVELRFAAAYDSDERQVQQIDSLVATGIDLLIVAPNQVATISPAIDRTYDAGIPVIVFERKTNSKKYTASVSADNYEMGNILADHIARKLNGTGNIIEVKGLEGSSPSIDRHNGFQDGIAKHPGIHVIGTAQGDWTEQSAYFSVKNMLAGMSPSAIDGIDYVFAQNDRMAMGARKAFIEYQKSNPTARQQLPLFSGIDGLSGPDGGIRLVCDSILDATYIYPTLGDQLLELAVDILKHKPYKKENLQVASLVTIDNAKALSTQAEEADRQQAYLDSLHDKVSDYLELLSNQRMMNILALTAIGMLLVTLVLLYLYYLQRTRINEERQQIARDKLDMYTEISHQLRTPLTLMEGPLNMLDGDDEFRNISKEKRDLFDIVVRNTHQLSALINKFLHDVTNEHPDDINIPSVQIDIEPSQDYHGDNIPSDERPHLLIVDDNDDIRHYLRTILQDRYEIAEAADGMLGLEQAHLEVPDLIISDVMMPNMNGLQFCQNIKNDLATSHIPVILLTARAMSQHQIEGYEHGADAYITKPFDERILLSRIINLLQIRRRLRTLWSTSSGTPSTSATLQPAVSERESSFMKKLNEIIDQRMGDSELSIEDIGSDIGLSRVQLYRKVKALTGISPVELLRKQRLLRAHTLLRTTDKTVSEVAYTVGFSAPSYFTKCFKEEFGMLPGELNSK